MNMLRLFFSTLFWSLLLGPLAFPPAVLGQKRFSIPPDAAAILAKTPVPPPPNNVTGVDIDRFIGSPFQSPNRLLNDAILTRVILRGGNPYEKGEHAAVLEYRKELALGTVLPYNLTSLANIPDQLFIFVEDGKGRLDDGGEFWDLHEGIGVLIPPHVKFRIRNSSDVLLHMLMLTWSPQPGAKPASGIFVRDVDQLPLTTCGGEICHWSYFGKNIFNSSHGLAPREAFHLVYVPPMSIGEPHAHVKGWEEIWTKLPPYDSYLTLGSEIREMPVNTAYLAPPNGKTVHAVINLRKDKPESYLFIGTFIFDQPDYGRDPLVAPQHLLDKSSN